MNGVDDPKVYVLTHDIKRAILDSGAQSGHVNILSTQGAVGVTLMDAHKELHNNYMNSLVELFAEAQESSKPKRSGAGSDRFHMMAQAVGLSLTVPFEGGRIISNPAHEIFAFDFEPKAGRREFIITIVGES